MWKIKTPVLVILCAAIIVGGAFFQAYKMIDQAPDQERQLLNKSIDLLEKSAPSFIFGRLALMVDGCTQAVASESNNLWDYTRIGQRIPKADLDNLLRNLKVDSKADSFVIVENKGNVLYRSSNPDNKGDSIVGFPVVRELLNGVITDDTMELDGVPMYIVGVPFADDKGTVVGGVMFGYRLSSTLLEMWERDMGAYIGIIWNGTIASASNPNVNDIATSLFEARELKGALTMRPPSGMIVPIGNGRKVIATGVPGQLRQKLGFVIVPKVLSDLSEISIFSVAMELWIAVGIAVLIAIIGSILIVRGQEHDIKLLHQKVVQAFQNQDTSIIQPQAFARELRSLALAIRDNMCSGGMASQQEPKKPSALDLANEMGGGSSMFSAGSGSDTRGAQGMPEHQPEDDGPQLSESAVSELEALLQSSLGGGAAQKPMDEPMGQRIQPALPTDDETGGPEDDEQSELMKMVQQAAAAEAQHAKPQMPAHSASEDLRVTLHGGPGGVAAVDADDLDGSMNDPLTQEFEKVFQEYIRMRQKLGEPTEKLSRKKFFANLGENRRRLMEKFNCRDVKFNIFEKGGKASVKASPVR